MLNIYHKTTNLATHTLSTLSEPLGCLDQNENDIQHQEYLSTNICLQRNEFYLSGCQKILNCKFFSRGTMNRMQNMAQFF